MDTGLKKSNRKRRNQKGRMMYGTEVMNMQATKTYYKVIVLKIDVFESEIVDERHFPTVTEAMSFCDNVNSSTEYTTLAVKM